MPVHALERLALARRLRDDELARVAVGHAVAGAKVVEQLFAADAEAGLERRRAVVDARVDDLAVARRRLLARRQVPLQEERRGVAGGEGARRGEADGPGADDLVDSGICVRGRKEEKDVLWGSTYDMGKVGLPGCRRRKEPAAAAGAISLACDQRPPHGCCKHFGVGGFFGVFFLARRKI